MPELFKNQNLREPTKENVVIVASMAIKLLIVMKEIQTKKRKILEVVFGPQNRTTITITNKEKLCEFRMIPEEKEL